ncbi:MAG TPA: hypothetical protein VMA75_00780 [Candidatus Paceibacterota bacterium]|nr:hypothetical protein [Candidatus Paceibacterota bacterium]
MAIPAMLVVFVVSHRALRPTNTLDCGLAIIVLLNLILLYVK